MAKSFSNKKAQHQKDQNLYKMKDGLSTTVDYLDLFSQRYLYWINNFPVECLSFDRRKFTNKEKIGKRILS